MVELNHTIVWCSDKKKSSEFLIEMLDLDAAVQFGHMLVVGLSNGVSLDYYETSKKISPQHYAFLISEQEFDDVLNRIKRNEMPYWADPEKTIAKGFNKHDGGRGLYFEDPDGHLIEIITKPYVVQK